LCAKITFTFSLSPFVSFSFLFLFLSSLAVNFIVALFLHIMGTLEVGIRAGQTFLSFFFILFALDKFLLLLTAIPVYQRG